MTLFTSQNDSGPGDGLGDGTRVNRDVKVAIAGVLVGNKSMRLVISRDDPSVENVNMKDVNVCVGVTSMRGPSVDNVGMISVTTVDVASTGEEKANMLLVVIKGRSSEEIEGVVIKDVTVGEISTGVVVGKKSILVSIMDIVCGNDWLGIADDMEEDASGVGNRVGIKTGVLVGKSSIMLVVSVKDITSEIDWLGTGDDAEVKDVSSVGNKVEKIIVSVTSSVVNMDVSEGSNVEGDGIKILIEGVMSELSIGRSIETVDIVGLISTDEETRKLGEGTKDAGEGEEMLVGCEVMSGPGVDVSGRRIALDVMNNDV